MSSDPRIGPATVAIIGGGPAGLSAAEALSHAGLTVKVFDAMPSPGRKFLLAGKGGLNMTHAEPLATFLTRYGDRQALLEPHIRAFGPEALRAWAHDLGVETFVGSSGRVFPAGMKAAPLLRSWLQRLRARGVHLHVRHRWQGVHRADTEWQIDLVTPAGRQTEHCAALVLAMGGGSWARLGSDGAWLPTLRTAGVNVAPLQPSNCGFDTVWSAHFRERFAGAAIKNIAAWCGDEAGASGARRGECLVSDTGLEGGLVYALSAALRQQWLREGHATLWLDLMPARTERWLADQIAKGRGARSMASHLQNQIGLTGVKAGLLREVCSAETYADPRALAARIKALPVTLTAMRPVDEAISTAGGVQFEGLDEHLMIKHMPGVFCAGEMLDWDAPTGGYLLTACMATGRAAGLGALRWLSHADQAPASGDDTMSASRLSG